MRGPGRQRREQSPDGPSVEVVDVTDVPLDDLTFDPIRMGAATARRPLPALAPRSWLIVAAVALVAGVMIGYALGYGRGPAPAAVVTGLSAPASAPLPSPASTSDEPILIDPLDTTGKLCGIQIGERELQLGVEVRNSGDGDIDFERVAVDLPLGGLSLRSTAAGSACGQVPSPATPLEDFTLPSGGRTWLLADLVVTQAGCPQALPVTFLAVYDQADHEHLTRLPGFSDLGSVRFQGC